MDYFDTIRSSLKKKSAIVGVIGLGQVGLPTALIFSEAGFSVIGHDINKTLLEKLEEGEIPFVELGLEEILRSSLQKKKFHIEQNIENLIKKCDVIIICVATPLTSEILPDLSFLTKVCVSISQFSIVGKLLLVESSIPPYTFDNLVLATLNKKNDLGKNFWIAFVPERLAPGQAISEIKTTPRIIGCKDEQSGILTKLLYQNIVKSKIVISSVRIAEISKLVENTYRDVNIAFANEIAKICELYGVNFHELRKVCNTHPRVNLLAPGPGVGGPCLPKDPYLLLNPQGNPSIRSNLITEARKVNDFMPFHILDIINNEFDYDQINDIVITVLGVTYKANVSDTRYSPALQIIPSLKQKGFEVHVHDPYSDETFGGTKTNNLWDSISKSSMLLILTDHSDFKSINLEKIQETMKRLLIFDCKGVFKRNELEKLGIKYLSIGYNPNKKSNQ